MTMQRKLLLIIGVIAAAAALFAAGVSLDTLLLVSVMLLCPAAMYFGMGGMQQGGCHEGNSRHTGDGTTQNHVAESDLKRAA